VSFENPTTSYVASIIGAFRVDVVTYRGGNVGSVADVLDRCYSDVLVSRRSCNLAHSRSESAAYSAAVQITLRAATTC
jgi:hypothetical protein